MAEKATNGGSKNPSKHTATEPKNNSAAAVKFNKQSSGIEMPKNGGANKKDNNIPTSKTLDSIASLQHHHPKTQILTEFKRPGILLLAKSDAEGGNGDLLCSGTLTLGRKESWQGPILEWIPVEENENNSSSPHPVGSLSDREWTVVSEALAKRNVRPIEFELCELKSFRVSDDGNRLVLIQRDGTRHPPLIFLDEGPEELVNVMRR
jgi:hypothetical protein